MAELVMVVDDNPTTRHLIGVYLKGHGYALLEAENGLDALEKLAQGSVDLIITDVNMPQMDGVGLTRALKQDQALGTIPVLILTSEDGGPGTAQRAGGRRSRLPGQAGECGVSHSRSHATPGRTIST